MSRASAALLAALVLTAANAAKPLVIDDTAYVAFARQALADPSDPFGFELYWDALPQPAIRDSVPAAFPYWLAASMAVSGERPVAWKLLLLPFALVLSGSIAFLLGRFAPAAPTWLLFPIVLGPTVLPGLNLMLDVPTIALGLFAYTLFVLACERASPARALAAGLVLALAMHTKYSALIYAPLMLAHAVLYRRLREGAVALGAAAALFLGWEGLLVARYGESHLLAGLARQVGAEIFPALARLNAQAPGSAALYWTLCLLSLLGGTALFPALLAALGLGAGRRIVTGAGLAAGVAFAAIPMLPPPPVFAAEGFFARLAAFNPELFLFVPLGLCTAAVIGTVAWRLLRHADPAEPRPDRMLAIWLALEILSFFAIAPFPAARRVIGLEIAASVLAARAVSLRAGEALAGLGLAAALGLAQGALYFSADLCDANARRDLVARVAERLPQLGARPESETVWYNGHWEFQYYADQAGMRPVIAGRSQLRPQDWLILTEGTNQPPLSFPSSRFREQDELVAVSRSPWSTMPLYYDGPVPLRRQPATQTRARIFRVTGDWVSQLQVSPP